MATSGQPLDERDRERIRKLREAGVSVRQVAAAMSVSPWTVQKVVRQPPCNPHGSPAGDCSR